MIVVENLSKTFKKEEKEKGLRGSLKSLFSFYSCREKKVYYLPKHIYDLRVKRYSSKDTV